MIDHSDPVVIANRKYLPDFLWLCRDEHSASKTFLSGSGDGNARFSTVGTLETARRWRDDPNNWETYRLTRRVQRLGPNLSPIAKFVGSDLRKLFVCFGRDGLFYEADGLQLVFDECTTIRRFVELHSFCTRDRHLHMRMMRLLVGPNQPNHTADDLVLDAPLRVFYPKPITSSSFSLKFTSLTEENHPSVVIADDLKPDLTCVFSSQKIRRQSTDSPVTVTTVSPAVSSPRSDARDDFVDSNCYENQSSSSSSGEECEPEEMEYCGSIDDPNDSPVACDDPNDGFKMSRNRTFNAVAFSNSEPTCTKDERTGKTNGKHQTADQDEHVGEMLLPLAHLGSLTEDEADPEDFITRVGNMIIPRPDPNHPLAKRKRGYKVRRRLDFPQ